MRMIIVLGLATAGACLSSQAATPKNALGAIAVSPDGATVVAAGDNQALYVVDPASLAVKQRVHLGVNPLSAFFSADGGTLALFDTDGTVHFYATSDWSEKASVPGGVQVSPMASADAIAMLSSAKGSGDAATTALTILALGDGTKKAELSIKGKAEAVAAAPDGSGFIVLLERVEDESESKEKAGDDLKGAARDEFELKHDGYSGMIVALDAAGAETARAKTWYSPTDNVEGAMTGGSAYFVGYSNKGLKVGPEGDGTYFELPISYLYGQASSADATKLAAGSLRDGAIYSLADGSAASFEIESKPGWPEYFEGFAFAPDGSLYAGTTSYRLIHVGADGKVIAAQPIF